MVGLSVIRGGAVARARAPHGGLDGDRGRAASARRCRRALAAAVAGLGLASCSSMSLPGFDSMKPKPTSTLLLIESNPAGAEAKTSLGQKCITPCTMKIGSGDDFTVTFTLAGHVPQTLTVHSKMNPGGWNEAASPVFDPPSLFPTLDPIRPPTAARKPPPKPPA
jgi:hypothetical protein